MLRKFNLSLLLVFLALALLTVSACTAEQQAQNEVTNTVNATADAARLKVNQFTGFAQSLVDQLAQEAKDPAAATAKANQISYGLDDINAKLQAVINAAEDAKHDSLQEAKSAVDDTIQTVREVADEATNPEIKSKLNEIADGLEEIQQGLVDLINEQSK
jgi:ribosomal protein L7/L12